MQQLWVDKYRPNVIDDYVFKDQKQRSQIENWIKSGAMAHTLLSGSAGVGKTSLAKLLFKELKVNPYDIKEINASKDNGVDYIRDSVVNFAQIMPFGEFKYVLLDEADFLSPNAQAVLRNVMEKYSSNVRFILTCNYPNKIMPAIHSRCQGFHIDKLDKDEFTVRVANILISENIEFDMETLDTYVSSSYPDLRKCINLLQQNSYNNKLTIDTNESTSTSDYRLEMVSLFKAGQYKEARQLICTQAGAEEYDDIYRFLYQNVDLFADNVTKEDKCIIAIRDGLVKHTMVSDVEINLSATITELSMIAQGIL